MKILQWSKELVRVKSNSDAMRCQPCAKTICRLPCGHLSCILMFVGVYLDNARGYEPRVKEIIFCTELYSSLETVSAPASSFSEALKMTKEEVETLPAFAQQLRRNYTVTVFKMSP